MEQGAQVKFGAVDLLAKDVTTYVNRRGVVGRDGRIDWALGLMNDGNTISENVTNLMGDGSYADTKTVTIGRGNQTQNFTTKVVHFGKHSEGWILKHGVQKIVQHLSLTELVRLNTVHLNQMHNNLLAFLC